MIGRRLLRSRHFHALWIGALLLVLGIRFDVVWIAALVVFFTGGALLLGQWLISTWKSPARTHDPEG